MDESSVARASRARTTARATREQRGLALAEERFEEIWLVGQGTWRVPSCASEPVKMVYLARLRHQSCTCEDHWRTGAVCKHVFGAHVVRAKTATCAGCGSRFRRGNLYEVTEDHDSLTWFVGDLLCEECALAHGVL